MDFLSIDNVMRQAKSIIVNPQVATYACIGITTTVLAYYTIFENDESSKPEERNEAPIEEPKDEPEEKESPIEEDSAQESVEEEPAAPLAGGKRKKMSRMNKNKDKKNKSKRKQSK